MYLDRVAKRRLVPRNSVNVSGNPYGRARLRRPEPAAFAALLQALGEQALQESAVTAKRIWDGIVEVWGRRWEREVS